MDSQIVHTQNQLGGESATFKQQYLVFLFRIHRINSGIFRVQRFYTKYSKISHLNERFTVSGLSGNNEIIFNYDLSDASNENWTSEGLKLTDAEISQAATIFVGNISFLNCISKYQFNSLTINSTAQKITTAYDFDSEPVTAFRLKKVAEVYPMPALQLSSGRYG